MLERISKYHIDSILSQGAMGAVYLATDEASNQTVVVRTIHPQCMQDKAGLDFAQQFKSQASSVIHCQHENLISLYEVGQYQDTPFVVMEFVKGYGLDRLLQSLAPLPLECISDFFLAICAGLEYAHQQGFVHQHLKPTNILVLEDDSIKIADLGIAKYEDLENSLANTYYKAPEQKMGMTVDCRADIYALGIIAFELLTLCDDLPSQNYTISSAPHLNLNTKLPHSLVVFLDSCLNPSATKRFSNMTEVIKAYQAAIRNIDKQPSPSPSQHPSPAANVELTPSQATLVTAEPIANILETPPSLTTLELIHTLKGIHPILNEDWQKTIPLILQQLDTDTRHRCHQHILEPKGISLTSTGELTYTNQQNLSHAKKILLTQQLNTLTDKLLTMVAEISKTRNILDIGDALEAGLKLISNIDTNSNLAQQQEKHFLTESFLYDFAIALRHHDVDIPKNQRDLSVDMIKRYMVEVYIKQKLLNYRFSPLPLRELKKDQHLFINTELFNTAKTHHLSIVATSRYLFVMREFAKLGVDPYCIKRFLIEEPSTEGLTTHFNTLAIERNQLSNPDYLAKIRIDLSRIVTVAWQLNQRIIELVAKLENVRSTHLLPLLTKSFATDDANLQTVIEDRLRDYERNLCVMVLNKVTRTLKEHAKSADDYEFLFLNLKSFLIESISNIDNFYVQLPEQVASLCQEMGFKLVAYLCLLEKRKLAVFNKERDTALAADNDLNYRKPTDELTQLVNTTAPILQDLKDTLKEAQQEAAERTAKQKSWDTFLGRKHIDPTDVQASIDQVADESHATIMDITQRHQNNTVDLAFEGVIAINESVRYYAFPRGEEGISLLPMLIKLPKNTSDFDIFAIKELLKPTLFS